MAGWYLEIDVRKNLGTIDTVTKGDMLEGDGALDRGIPPKAAVLSAHVVAGKGGETEFASTYAAYDALSYTHRKEWVRWVEEAKKPETRATRIEKTVSGLREGRKSH